jgi:hypothetical protein
MNLDAELDVWREQWQSDTPVPGGLRRKVERQSRFMKLMLLADILVTVVIGGGTVAWAVLSPMPGLWLLAGATWLFITVAWAFSFRINRGTWSPAAMNTAAFLDLSIRRCRGRLAALRFGAALYVCEVVFCLGWVYQHGDVSQPLLKWLWFGTWPIDIVWGCTAVFYGLVFWYRRKKKAELAYFVSLQSCDTLR